MSTECRAASDYVWLVDYSGGQHGGPPKDEQSAGPLFERIDDAIEVLDEHGPASLDNDLERVRIVWRITSSGLDREVEDLATDIAAEVPGGLSAAKKSGDRVVAWAKETCGQEKDFGKRPEGFDG